MVHDFLGMHRVERRTIELGSVNLLFKFQPIIGP